MGTHSKVSFLVILALLIPSTVFSQDQIKSGYDLYENMKLMDNPETPEQAFAGFYTMGFMAGCLDGFSLMQDILYKRMFPREMMSEQERNKYAKRLNFNRLNVPEEGLPTGQLMLIFKKYAEKHPEKLHNTARACLFEAIADAYGWK